METRAARLERHPMGLLELHFKPAVRLERQDLAEIHAAKRSLCLMDRPDMLAVLPPEFEFDMNILVTGHVPVGGQRGLVRRLAMVAAGAFEQDIARIYFRYHPREGDTAIFTNEAEARTWLTSEVPAPSLS